MSEKNEIDVSVYVITYFHEKCIKQALDSILSQKTHYKYEIVVSDDGSTDGTMDILRQYEACYSAIRVFHNEKNIGIPLNIYSARCHCRGKYIVCLAGDDYWINDNKLEAQVSFLENHEEYVAVGNAMELRYDDDECAYQILPKKKNRDKPFTLRNYEKGETFYAHGFMMRNYFLTEDGREYFKQAQEISDKVDDGVDNLLLLKKGNIYVMDIITDVYRVPRKKSNRSNYNSKFSRAEKAQNSISLYNSMYNKFGNEVSFKAKYINTMSVALLGAILSRDFHTFNILYKSIPEEYRKPFYSSVGVKCIPKAFVFGLGRIRLLLRKI